MKQTGRFLIRLRAALLIAAALCFIIYHLYEEHRAREQSGQALDALQEYIPRK